MKISFTLTIGMSLLFLIFIVSSLVIIESNIQELKNATVLKNTSITTGIIDDLDRSVKNRIDDFKSLVSLQEIQDELIESNNEFRKLTNVEEFLEQREQEFETQVTAPFVYQVKEGELSTELKQKISFYREVYDYDVVNEIFVTNEFGANIALGIGVSDYRQDDEVWWQNAKIEDLYIGNLEFSQNYDTYAVPFGIRITDKQGNFLGVLRVLISVDDLTNDLVDDAEILSEENKIVKLLDENGRVIFDSTIRDNILTQNPIGYFDKITDPTGSFEYENDGIRKAVSYSTSTGFEDFQGFGWIVIIEEDEDSIINEFIDVRNTLIFGFILGIIGAIIIGVLTSYSIARPLNKLTSIATKLSNGDFDIQPYHTRYDDIKTIVNAFVETTKSLKKLIATERELAEAKAQVKNERLTAIGELSSSIAHDLKNPLATIKTATHLLKQSSDKLDPEVRNQVFPKLDRAIKRMSHQIGDVLNYVRITPVNVTNTSIRSLLQSAISSIEIPKNINIKLPESDFQIKCDVNKIEVVFINLLLNAIQAIDDAKGQIKIHLHEQKDDFVIEFEDTGRGVSEYDKARIFEPLYTTKQKGTGLGLAICKNIVEQHGWSIGVKTNPTKFFIKIKK